jgi:hypothetical protein
VTQRRQLRAAAQAEGHGAEHALRPELTAGKRHIRVTLAPAAGSAGTLFGLVAFSRCAGAGT